MSHWCAAAIFSVPARALWFLARPKKPTVLEHYVMPLHVWVETLLLGNDRDVSHPEQGVSGKAPRILQSQHSRWAPWLHWLRWGAGLRMDTWEAFWIQTLAPARTDCVTLGKSLYFSESDSFFIFNLGIIIAHNCEDWIISATEAT